MPVQILSHDEQQVVINALQTILVETQGNPDISQGAVDHLLEALEIFGVYDGETQAAG